MFRRMAAYAACAVVLVVVGAGSIEAEAVHPSVYGGPKVNSSAWGLSGQFANGSGYENFTVISGASLVATAWGAFIVHNNSSANGLCRWFITGTPYFKDSHNLAWTTEYCFTFSARAANGTSGQVGHFLYFMGASTQWSGANGTDQIRAFFNSSLGNESVTPFGINGISLLNLNETVAASALGNGSVNNINGTNGDHVAAVSNSLVVASDEVSLAGTTSGERSNATKPLKPVPNATVTGTVAIANLSAGNPEFWSGQAWDDMGTAGTIATSWHENVSVRQGVFSIDLILRPPQIGGLPLVTAPWILILVALGVTAFSSGIHLASRHRRSVAPGGRRRHRTAPWRSSFTGSAGS